MHFKLVSVQVLLLIAVMWMATWIQWTVPHAHHACLEGPALQICGNQINEIQCVRQCTCTCYAVHDMCILCYVTLALTSVMPIVITLVRTVQYMWTGVTDVHTQVGVFCSIYCSVLMYLCTFWNSLCSLRVYHFCGAVSVQFWLCLGLALYLLHCMHMCLWATFQKYM